MQLSKNFSLEELVRSDTAALKKIDNTPNNQVKCYLERLAKEVLQPIRDAWGKPIKVTSGYRSKKLNDAINGSKTSQHMLGQAADIKVTSGKNKELFDLIYKMIKEGKLKVGQLIWEKGTKAEPAWVHVSLPYSKVNNILYIYN